MFFRNLTLFRFPTSVDFSDLEPLLPNARSSRSARWSCPRAASCRRSAARRERSPRIGDALWLTVGGEDKILPGAVVNDLLQKKLAEIEEKEGRKPGGRTRKRLKDDLVTSCCRARSCALAHRCAARPAARRVAVDTSSRKTGENGGVAKSAARWAASRRCRSTPKSRRARPDRLDRRRCRCPKAWRWATNANCAIPPTPARWSSASARNCRATKSPSTWKPASRSRGWRWCWTTTSASCSAKTWWCASFKLLDGAVDQLEGHRARRPARRTRRPLRADEPANFRRLFLRAGTGAQAQQGRAPTATGTAKDGHEIDVLYDDGAVSASPRRAAAPARTPRMQSLFRLLAGARIAPSAPPLQRDSIGFVLDDGRHASTCCACATRARAGSSCPSMSAARA
jgi:hypothetical protein